MADLKLSELTSVPDVLASNILLTTSGTTSYKMSLEQLALNMPVRVNVVEATETLTVSGVIATNTLVTKIKALTSGAAYTLAAGTHGMEKIIVCNSADVTTPTATVTVTNSAGFTTIEFNAIGDSVHLKNIDGTWFSVGSNSVTLA